MRRKQFINIQIILLFIIGLISCSQKSISTDLSSEGQHLPENTISGTGLLIIPHYAKNRNSMTEFEYGYELFFMPVTKATMKIIPGQNDFIIFGPLPAGQYRINKIKTISIGASFFNPDKDTSISYPQGIEFQIKGNYITILDNKFRVIQNDKAKFNGPGQFWDFQYFSEMDKADLIREIRKLENAEDWIFFTPYSKPR